MRNSQRGDVFAWFASMLVVIALPLSSLSIDVVRMMYVSRHLQTATDAACQAAADALDTQAFVNSGVKKINPALARTQASQVFSATLVDASKVKYKAGGLSLSYPTPTSAHCVATATVTHIISITPPMKITVQTTSEMRVLTGGAK
jgi:uncharacterized membrane protein